MTEPILKAEDWTEQDRVHAQEIWEQYQQDHDLSDRKGDTAGIDPRSGEVWLGKSILDISDRRREAGVQGAMFFERIGYPTYLRKGRRPYPGERPQ